MQEGQIALIWDMDGVLVDSAEYHLQSWRETLKSQLHRDISITEFRNTFGLRNPEMLRIVLGIELPVEQIAHLSDTKEARYRELLENSGIRLLPGVPEWLEYAREHDWLQAVASSAPRANVEVVVDTVQIRSYFAALITAEDVSLGKPDPEVFLAAARALQVPAQRCVVIEDAPAGTDGARRAGMACIGVLTTHNHLDANVVVSSLCDIQPSTVSELLQV